MRLVVCARAVEHGALIKGGHGRKSDRVIDLARAQKLALEGRIVSVGTEAEVETTRGVMTVPVFRSAKPHNRGLRGLSARMSGPGYVDLLGKMTGKSEKNKSDAESLLEGWKGERAEL
jgi:hypothetical protein